jgi:hypothetical protein
MRAEYNASCVHIIQYCTSEFVVRCDMCSLLLCMRCRAVTEDMYLQPPQIWARESSADSHKKIQSPDIRAAQSHKPHRLLDFAHLPPPQGHELFSAAYLVAKIPSFEHSFLGRLTCLFLKRLRRPSHYGLVDLFPIKKGTIGGAWHLGEYLQGYSSFILGCIYCLVR